VLIDDSEVVVPHFLSSVVDYLKKHKDTEGIFRKAGSAARQKLLRSEVSARDPFLTSPLGGQKCPPGVKLSTEGEILCLPPILLNSRVFTPSM
jgi:hypothetical protein